MHAAIIAMAVVNMLKSKTAKSVEMKQFMIEAPDERVKTEVGKAFDLLKLLAKKVPNGSRKTSRKAGGTDR